jgi:hypothetical protein
VAQLGREKSPQTVPKHALDVQIDILLSLFQFLEAKRAGRTGNLVVGKFNMGITAT